MTKHLTPGPSYYTWHPTHQTKDVATFLPYNVGVALAYLWRAGRKPGSPLLEDLRKALDHIQFEQQRWAGVGPKPRKMKKKHYTWWDDEVQQVVSGFTKNNAPVEIIRAVTYLLWYGDTPELDVLITAEEWVGDLIKKEEKNK